MFTYQLLLSKKIKYYLFISLYPYTHTDVWSVVGHRAPVSMGFPRQEYWSGLPFPSSWDLPHPGIESMSPALAGRFFIPSPPVKPVRVQIHLQYILGFPGGSVVKKLFVNAGDIEGMDLIPGLVRSPGERKGNPLQYSYL